MANGEREISNHLAQNILSLRKQRGLSQGQLSELTRIPRSTLTYIESGSGNPSLQNLVKLAKGLNVSLEELLRPAPLGNRLIPADQVPKQSKGQVQIAKLLPEAISGMDIDYLEFKARARLGGVPHLAQTREYFTCLSGKIEVSVEGEKYLVNKGDVLIFRGDQKHSYYNPAPTLATAVSVVTFAHDFT